jgi:hypothetical protein
VRVLADSHAILWLSQRSPELSDVASDALFEAEETEGVVVSVASLVDLWYVTQSTNAVTEVKMSEIRTGIVTSPSRKERISEAPAQ